MRIGTASPPRDLALCTFYVVLAMALSLSIGQDMNWDLLNYHFYNPYLLLGNRFERDIYAAGTPTFLNPILDLPVYFAIRHLPPVVLGMTLAAFHGISLWLVHRLTTLLLDPSAPRVAAVAGLVAAVTAASGAGFHSELGSTMGNSTISVFVLAALVLLLAEIGSSSGMSRVRWAGFLIGLAMGAKLIAGIYAIGLAAVCLATAGNRRQRLTRVVNFAVAAGGGLLVTGGYWMALMSHHYRSPLFPFYNAIFRSPFGHGSNFADTRFLPRSLLQTLVYPLYIAREQNLVAELVFRDARLLAAWLSLALLGVLAPVRLVRTGIAWRGPQDARLARLGLFFGVSYLVWLKMFSIYRYAVPIELVSGALVVGALAYALRQSRIAVAVALPVCLFLFVWTKPLDYGRVPWSTSDSYFGVNTPALQSYEAATVLMWDMPNAYLVPFFPESATFLRLEGGSRRTLMWDRLRERVSRTRHEHLFFLETETHRNVEGKSRALRELGLALDTRRCQWIPLPPGWTLATTPATLIHRICALRQSDEH